jgi:hypothetical protein
MEAPNFSLLFAVMLLLLFGCASAPSQQAPAQNQSNVSVQAQPQIQTNQTYTPASSFPPIAPAQNPNAGQGPQGSATNATGGVDYNSMPASGDSVLAPANDSSYVLHVVYFFGGTCQYSARSTPIINDLNLTYANRSVIIHFYEVWANAENRKLYDKIADAYRISPDNRGVPLAFIDGEYLMGYEKINTYLEQEIDVCLKIKCPNPLEAPLRPEITRPL